MRKALLVTVLFLIVGLAAIVLPVSIRYDYVQYEKDMQAHILSLSDGPVLAEYKGDLIAVADENIDRIFSTLTASSRKRLFKMPSVDPTAGIKLIFPDGATFTAYLSGEDSNTTYLHYTFHSLNRWLAISKLDTFNWLEKSVRPQGLLAENEIIGRTSDTSRKPD